jgi:hypothetical protein
MNHPEWVKSCLRNDISSMAENPNQFCKNPDADFTRTRKLDFESLLYFLISREAGSTSHELLKHFDFSTDTPSKSAFFQQRQKLLPETFPYLLDQFNSHFPLGLYKEKYNLVAADGCEFNIARNPVDADTFHPPNGKSTKGFNMLQTVALYDLISKRYLDCVIQPSRNKNEFRAICDLMDSYPYEGNPIFIGDRGFSSYNLFAHAKCNSRLFLVRAKDINVRRLLNLETLPDFIDTSVEIILTRTNSKKKRKYPEMAEQYRYIGADVDFDYIEPGSCDEFPISLRIVRIISPEGVLVSMITNLPPEEFSTDEIMLLYRMRWDIETSFRDLKHTIGTTNFHSKKFDFIVQEIWTRLILFNFCSIITMNVIISQGDTKHVYQVNFAMAMKICHNFIRRREHDSTPNVEALIGSFTLPIRLGRTYPRQHRFQLPASFCYRFA